MAAREPPRSATPTSLYSLRASESSSNLWLASPPLARWSAVDPHSGPRSEVALCGEFSAGRSWAASATLRLAAGHPRRISVPAFPILLGTRCHLRIRHRPTPLDPAVPTLGSDR